MTLGEFNVHHNNFVSGLIKEIPQLTKTINLIFEMKRKRKLRMATEPVIKGNEGAEDNSELDWDVTTHTETEF